MFRVEMQFSIQSTLRIIKDMLHACGENCYPVTNGTLTLSMTLDTLPTDSQKKDIAKVLVDSINKANDEIQVLSAEFIGYKNVSELPK